MLALPGFMEAHRFDPEATKDERVIHKVHYILSEKASLDRYLETDAERMRAPGVALFGDDLRSSREIREFESRSETRAQHCLNCNAAISGQYCWNCGQRSNTRLISLFELVRDAFGDMFELDSRLWRTLIPLFAKPGFLTAEYLRGRRARYMPPFRMYLVMSFIFFLLTTAFDSNSAIELDPSDDQTRLTGIEFNEDGLIISTADDEETNVQTTSPEPAAVPSPPIDGQMGDTPLTVAASETKPPETPDSVDDDDEEFYCNVDFTEIGLPWLNQLVTERRAEAICEHIQQDNGQRLKDRFIQNLPVGALLLLPLLALLLKFLYPLSRRYYVEHLLLLVHFHSFLFLAGSLQFGYNQLLAMTPAPDWLFIVPNILLGLYMPLYLYKALRRVYTQGRLATIFKYLMLFAGYLTAIITIILGMTLYLLVTY